MGKHLSKRLRKQLAVLTAAVLTAVGSLLTAAACTEDDPGGPAPTSAGPPAACAPATETALGAWADAGFSGSVAVLTGDRFDCLAAYGSADDATDTPNTIDTVFSIGSVTKAFTAAAVFHLVDDGKLALDDTAGELLPGLTGPVGKVTVNQLLLHSSGLNGSHGNDSEPLSDTAALAVISELELVAKPGVRHLYSNAGYTLLALIIERASGIGYRSYLASRILRLPDGRVVGGFWNGEPAAPTPRALGYLDGGRTGATGDLPGPYWAVEGNGGLAMTARDLAAWTHALFTGKVLSPDSTRAVGTPGPALGEGRAETPGWVAYDASRYGQPLLVAAGGGGDIGHNAVVAWLPGRRQAIAVTSNKPRLTAENLLQAVGPALAGDKPLPTPDVPVDTGALTAVTGAYRLDGGGTFDVTARENRLTITPHGADAVGALFPTPAGTPVDVVRGHEDRVRALLAGKTQEGRRERAAFEKAFAAIRAVDLAGTISQGSEIRTYVTMATGDRTVLGWYSLNEAGGVKAAEVPTRAPALRLLPVGDDRYRPDDPSGVRPEVTVGFAEDRMTLTGPGGRSVAHRVG